MSPPFEGFYLKSSGAKVYEKTMRTYPEELKAKIIARLLPPNNEYVPDVAKETGIPKDTLYAWRIKHRQGNQVVESGHVRKMTSVQKFEIVLETASMNEAGKRQINYTTGQARAALTRSGSICCGSRS